MRSKRGVRPMKCPNKACPNHLFEGHDFVKDGLYKNKVGKRESTQRFKCKACKKRFLGTHGTITYRLRKPEIHRDFVKIYSSGVSMRRSAYLISVNRKTLAHRLSLLGKSFKEQHDRKMQDTHYFKGSRFSFDEMESNIGGKRNPASISIAVNEESGRILAINVAWMPLKGRLVEKMNREGIPFPEYQDQRPTAYDASFKAINSQAMGYPITVVTDGYPSYPGYVKRNVERSPIHQVSIRSASADHDPMFWLNHVCARIRADLSRMGRKTWCVSRSIEALQHHLNIFMEFFNSRMYQTRG